jgi:hypothetical protein
MYSEYNRLLDKYENTMEQLCDYKWFAKEAAKIIFGVEKDISTNELQSILQELKNQLVKDAAEEQISK